MRSLIGISLDARPPVTKKYRPFPDALMLVPLDAKQPSVLSAAEWLSFALSTSFLHPCVGTKSFPSTAITDDYTIYRSEKSIASRNIPLVLFS